MKISFFQLDVYTEIKSLTMQFRDSSSGTRFNVSRTRVHKSRKSQNPSFGRLSKGCVEGF